MSVKVHVGSQTVYLRDWINMDVIHDGAGLAKDYPARVERWITDESDYYGRKKDKTPETIIKEGPESNDGDICDVWGSWQQMPFGDESVDEILSRQVFEHLSRPESMQALTEARRVLKFGGILRLDVPDHDETLKQLEEAIRTDAFNAALQYCEDPSVDHKTQRQRNNAQTKTDLMKRHLLGSRKNDWAVHMGSWTRPALIEFCSRYGFDFVEEEPNIHFYPAFCLRFKKGHLPKEATITDDPIPLRRAAWEYVKLPDVTDLDVLEIGPGRNPWPGANDFIDIDRGVVETLKASGFNAVEANVEALPQYSKKYDFVLTSHILEHVGDPIKAAAELSRVAEAGCVICPHPMKEGLFAAHETDHKWWVIAGKHCLYFHRIPYIGVGGARPEHLYHHFYDSEVAGQQHRLWRYGDPRLEGISRRMREWWYKNEPLLDVVYFWRGELKVQVLE